MLPDRASSVVPVKPLPPASKKSIKPAFKQLKYKNAIETPTAVQRSLAVPIKRSTLEIGRLEEEEAEDGVVNMGTAYAQEAETQFADLKVKHGGANSVHIHNHINIMINSATNTDDDYVAPSKKESKLPPLTVLSQLRPVEPLADLRSSSPLKVGVDPSKPQKSVSPMLPQTRNTSSTV